MSYVLMAIFISVALIFPGFFFLRYPISLINFAVERFTCLSLNFAKHVSVQSRRTIAHKRSMMCFDMAIVQDGQKKISQPIITKIIY
jgi:hypothetical protein